MRVADIKLLWGRSAGRCALCRRELTTELPRSGRVLFGEHAHIIPDSPRGPRGDGGCPGEAAYPNMILLCPTDHTLADKAPEDYSADELREKKQAHEEWVREALTPVRSPPVVWDVDYPRNAHLAGRAADLAALARRLADAPIQVLHGTPGVGKSQIAAHFAHANAADYRVVFWLDAHEEPILVGGFRNLARDLGLPEADDTDVRVLRRAVQAWLGENDGWLLLFDRARESSQLEGWLPDRPRGHVVVTSTSPVWRRLGTPHRLDPLDVAAGAQYLLVRTDSRERTEAERLAKTLGGLPLALEQAATYVETTGSTLARYAALFADASADLLAAGPAPSDYGLTVAATVGIASDGLPASALLLAHALAELDARWLPRPAVERIADALGEGAPRGLIEIDLALGALAGRALITLEQDRVLMHGLVQDVLRHQIQESDRPRILSATQKGLRDALVGDAQLVSSFGVYRDLLPHVLAVTGRAFDAGAVEPDTMHLLDRVATHLQQQGRYDEAATQFERAIEAADRFGTRDLDRLMVRMNQAACVDFIDTGKANELYSELLVEVGPEPSGDEALDTFRADLLQNLALNRWNVGQVARARELIGAALGIYERVVAERDRPNSKNVIDATNNDGLFAWGSGDYAHALEAWTESLRLIEASDAKDPAMRARALANLGVLFENLERAEDSERHHRMALDLRREHLPSDHPEVILSLGNLGGALRLRGRLEERKEHFDAALRLHEEAEQLALDRYGEDHLDVAFAVNNQALDLWQGGDASAAIGPARRALAIRERLLGEGHQARIQSRVNLGRILLDADDVDRAEDAFRAALDEWRRSDLPAHHVQVALAHDGLGRVALARGDRNEACREFRAAYEAFLALGGPDDPSTQRAAQRVEETCDD